VEEHQAIFDFIPVCFLIDIRKITFLSKMSNSPNSICSKVIVRDAEAELESICRFYAVTNPSDLSNKIKNLFLAAVLA
jgi:hypothetical protein